MSDLTEPFSKLDLEIVKKTILKRGWTKDQVDTAAAEYVKFLALNKEYSDTALAPCELVDSFWHTHLLDTAKYQADCEEFVGLFVHHKPNSPDTEDSTDQPNLAWDNTTRLYETHFGTLPPPWVTAATCTEPGCQNNPPTT